MADKPGVNKVAITLPEGMDEGQFLKLFQTFQNQRVATQGRDKAYRAAVTDLIKAHKTEFDGYLKAHGYAPKR